MERKHRLCGSCAPPTLLTDGPTAISATGTATVTAAGRDAGATSGAGCAAVAELEAGNIAGEGTSPSFQASRRGLDGPTSRIRLSPGRTLPTRMESDGWTVLSAYEAGPSVYTVLCLKAFLCLHGR
jgi:hypothetical protein